MPKSNDGRAPARRVKRSMLLGTGSLVVAGLLAACSTSASSGTSNPSTSASGSGGANLAAVNTDLAAALKPQAFIAPGPAFSAAKDAGKTVFNMPSDTADPFYTPITQAMQAAATAAHLKLVTYANEGTTSEWVQGIDQAISEHVGAIVLGGINPAVIAPQIAEAEAHHIVVEESHEYQEGVTTPSDLQANSYGAFAQAAQLMAVIQVPRARDHCHGHGIGQGAAPVAPATTDRHDREQPCEKDDARLLGQHGEP